MSSTIIRDLNLKKYDAFISYAYEDKSSFALPLAKKLESIGLNIWFDDFCLKVGDSLRQKIDFGLSNSNYGIVILSPNFFEKQWPQKELNALFSLEIDGRCAILPVWKDVTQKEVAKYSPLLADKIAAKAYEGVDKTAEKLVEVIDPNNPFPDLLLQEELASIQAISTKNSGLNIRVEAKKGYRPFGLAANLYNPFYNPSKSYICISVSNLGTNDVIIEKAGLHLKKGKKLFIVSTDSFFTGPRRLINGDRLDYFIDEDSIKDFSLIDYAWAVDMLGREWRGELKT